jgi:hypothetical protein
MNETTEIARVFPGEPSVDAWSILMVYRGSIAHGTYLPPEQGGICDRDILSICVPPPPFYLGLEEFGSRGTKELRSGPWDVLVYESRKTMRLLLRGNPNVLHVLWVPQRHVLRATPAGELLLASRDLFVGRHVAESFVGYARDQLAKMQSLAFQGYMGEKRKELVRRFGYDTKNAQHCIRLLRMLIEYLGTGDLQVERPDAEELLAIKRGEWSLERVHREADRLFREAAGALGRTQLREGPDFERAKRLAVQIVEMEWARRREFS